MRFRFCGDLDCPDWILAEINTLARMTSIKMKLLCQQVVKSSLSEELDSEKIKKLTADSKFEIGDVKACVAAIAFILTTSARHNVDEETLSNELQQLGLPREHSAALCRVYRDHLTSLTAHLQASSLRLSNLENVRWRMDFTSARNEDGEMEMHPELQLHLEIHDKVLDQKTFQRLVLTPDQLKILVSDLRKVTKIMDSLQE